MTRAVIALVVAVLTVPAVVPVTTPVAAQAVSPPPPPPPVVPPPTAVQAGPRVPPRDAVGPAPTGTGRISGRVVGADTRAPLRRVLVTLTGDSQLRRQVTTDADGRYDITHLPAGRFTLSAAKGGYLTLQYGQRRAFEPGRPLTLEASQRLGDVNLALPHAGAITGRVVDRFGDPAVGAEIQVERYQYGPDGQRRLTRVPTGGVANDLGEFRAFGLQPGEYVVSANLRRLPQLPGPPGTSVPTAAYVQTYYPGTPHVADAQAVLLDIGQEASVQFTLATGRLASVSGTITDSTGRPAVGASLMLTTTTSSGGTSGRTAGSVASDGAFAIRNIPPGDHFVQVRLPPRPDGSTVVEVANASISVAGEDIQGLQIATSPGVLAQGRVEWEGTAPRTGGAATSQLRVVAAATDGRPQLVGSTGGTGPAATGIVGADDSFRIANVLGSIRFSVIGVPPQWAVKAIAVNGADAMEDGVNATALGGDSQVRVVLTDRLSELTGAVTNARGERASEYVVVVLPEQPMSSAIAARYTQAARPDQQAAFRARALPPGRYVALAVEALEQGSEWDPVFQATVRRDGRRFTIDEGQSLTLNLTLAP